MNRGGGGARSLNIELQAALNPAAERKVERFGWIFAPGDKVMQIENDYDKEVYNGDIGFVSDVEPEEGKLTASFDGRSVTYGFGELDAQVPAYPQEPRLGIPSRGNSGHDAVLRHVAAEPSLHRHHPRQAACRAGRAEEGHRHRGAQRLGPAALVEAAGVAASRPVPLAADRHGGLTDGRRGFSRAPQVRQWLDGVDPAWTLLTFESLLALRQEPSAVQTAIRITNDLSANEIAGSPVREIP